MVRINTEDFLSRRPLHQCEASAITTRIQSLLGNYQCFHPSRQAHVHGHGHGPIPVRQFQRQQTTDTGTEAGWICRGTKKGEPSARRGSTWKRTCTETSNVRNRHIISSVDPATAATIDTLNKVTEDNYPRMLERIFSSVRSSPDPVEICHSILRKCYEQDFFLQVYLRILTDVLELSLGEDHKRLFIMDLSHFAMETMALDLDATFPRPCITDSGYDGFCDRVKLKKILVAKARTTIGLIDRGLVPSSREEFFSHAVTAVESVCKRKYQSVSEYDDDHADIAIEYLREFMALSKEKTHDRLQRMQCLLADYVEPSCSLMCKFKMQGIIGKDTCINVRHQDNSNTVEADLWQTTTRLRHQLRLPRQQSRR